MGIDIHWENERGEQLEAIPDPRGCLGLALAVSLLDDTICLCFIDPYENRVFNQEQIPVLINELQWLRQLVTPERIPSLRQKPFSVYDLKTGLIENRVPAKQLSAGEVLDHIFKILRLAIRSNGEIHTYLKIPG